MADQPHHPDTGGTRTTGAEPGPARARWKVAGARSPRPGIEAGHGRYRSPPGTSLSDPGVLRAVAGAGLYLTVLGLCGLGIGAVIRSSTGAVAMLFGVLFVPSLIVTLLPQSWPDTVGRYLPMVAGEAIITVHHEAHTLQPWPGFGVFCLYAAAALTAGIVLISRRDA